MNDQQFKADAGKAMPDLLEAGMPSALRLVQATMEYGAQKYEQHSWRSVPDAMQRYQRAARRHRQERDLDASPENGLYAVLTSRDDESGLPHIAHEIFNLLAMIELALQDSTDKRKVLDALLSGVKTPPTAHKVPPAATQQAREEDAIPQMSLRRSCMSCRYVFVPAGQYPCKPCQTSADKDHWKPK